MHPDPHPDVPVVGGQPHIALARRRQCRGRLHLHPVAGHIDDPDWNRTMIVRSEIGYVSNPNGGVLVYEGSDRETEDIGLSNFQPYYYTAFSLDAYDNCAEVDEYAQDWAFPGMSIFADDFETETLGEMPSRWEVPNSEPNLTALIYDDENRAYWDESGSRITCGSSTPSGSCTNGYFYWKTDYSPCSTPPTTIADMRTYCQDGALYQCQGGSWQQFFTAHTYPHPIRDAM